MGKRTTWQLRESRRSIGLNAIIRRGNDREDYVARIGDFGLITHPSALRVVRRPWRVP
jgi:hypothetical protein